MAAEMSADDEAGRLADAVRDKVPEQVRSRPDFEAALTAWARAQYLANRAFGVIAGMSLADLSAPTGRAAQGKSLLELSIQAEALATRLRDALGLKPADYAALRKDLGIAQAAEAEALKRLEERGKRLRGEQGEPDGTGT